MQIECKWIVIKKINIISVEVCNWKWPWSIECSNCFGEELVILIEAYDKYIVYFDWVFSPEKKIMWWI